jgi:O-antigen/teichoic acid export membrane protein
VIKKNLINSSGIFAVKALSNAGLFFIVAKLMSFQVVGQLAVGIAIFILFEQIYDFGAKLLILKEVPQAGVDSDLINKLGLIKLCLLLSLGLPATVWLFGFGDSPGLGLMVLAAFISSFAILLKAIFQAKNSFQFELRSNLIRTISVYVGLFLCLIYEDINFVFSGFVLGAMLELFYCGWQAKSKFRFDKLRISYILKDFLRDLSKSLPYAAHSIISVAYATFDIFIISALTSDEIVGVYQILIKLLFGGLILGSILSQAIYPVISRSRLGSDFIKTCFMWLRIYVALGLIIGIGCFLLGELFLQFFGISLMNSKFVILTFSIIIFIRYVTIVPGMVLTVSGSQGRRVFVLIVITILSVSNNYFLVPRYGIDGAFITLALSTAMSGGLYMLFFRQVVNKVQVENL